MSLGEMTLEVAALPELGDSAFYCPASPKARKLRVTVTEVFANGRIRIEFRDWSWKSVPRHYHKRVRNVHYGLVRIE
jgi:hypothetical protein